MANPHYFTEAGMQVRGVYMEIIDEVAIHMRQTFLDEGVDEQVLLDLKRKWAENLEESGALVPRENPLAPQTTTADADPNTTTTTTSAAAPAADTAAPTANAAAAAAATRGAFYPHASASASAAAAAATTTNTATATTTATTTTAEQVSALEARAPESYGGFKQADNEVAAVAAALPQTDGADGGDGSSAEAGGEIIGSRDEATSSEEESSEEEEEDEESTNYIICQWERIRKRTTHKWGASLSSGIMHLNGKDFMFNKCLGEYTW
eukprot:UC1_evm1s1645